MVLKWGLALLLVVLAGDLAAAAPAGYQITDDQFEPFVTVVSPPVSKSALEVFALRSFVDKHSKAVTHQLYVQVAYRGDDWRHYDVVYDDRATAHPATKVEEKKLSCDPGDLTTEPSCGYFEAFSADLSDGEMRDFAKAGASFKLRAKSGFSEIIGFDASFFAGQLSVLNSYVSQPYAVDVSALPAADPGLALYNVGQVNKRLYYGVDHGLNVSGVAKGSPAELAGIHRGDVVMDIGGVALDNMADYPAAVAKLHSGQSVPVIVKHRGQVITVNMGL